MISYEKMVNRLKENGHNQYTLKRDGKLGSATISKIFADDGKSGQSIDIRVVDKICKLLNCQPGDLLECIEDKEGYSDTSERHYRRKENTSNE